MKNLDEILKQQPVFLHNWEEKIDVIGDFEEIYMNAKEYRAEKAPYANIEAWEEKKKRMASEIEKYEPVNILFASYGVNNYFGDAFILLEKEGKLFEVNGSHCSCMGLEGQFDPEETTLEEIEFRLVNGKLGLDSYSDNEFASELKMFLGVS